MPRNYTSEIRSWDDAYRYLGNKRERSLPHSANLRIEKQFPSNWDGNYWERGADNSIVVRLHGNIIATYREGHPVDWTCESSYRNSMTTKRHRKALGGPWEV
jgi:hypothetical protein